MSLSIGDLSAFTSLFFIWFAYQHPSNSYCRKTPCGGDIIWSAKRRLDPPLSMPSSSYWSVGYRSWGMPPIAVENPIAITPSGSTSVATIDIAPPVVKREFANDPINLLVVDDSTNQSKSDKAPHEWLPPRKEYWCEYGKQWTFVKEKYALKMSATERTKLDWISRQCK
jgi:hypothetical protein